MASILLQKTPPNRETPAQIWISSPPSLKKIPPNEPHPKSPKGVTQQHIHRVKCLRKGESLTKFCSQALPVSNNPFATQPFSFRPKGASQQHFQQRKGPHSRKPLLKIFLLILSRTRNPRPTHPRHPNTKETLQHHFSPTMPPNRGIPSQMMSSSPLSLHKPLTRPTLILKAQRSHPATLP